MIIVEKDKQSIEIRIVLNGEVYPELYREIMSIENKKARSARVLAMAHNFMMGFHANAVPVTQVLSTVESAKLPPKEVGKVISEGSQSSAAKSDNEKVASNDDIDSLSFLDQVPDGLLFGQDVFNNG